MAAWGIAFGVNASASLTRAQAAAPALVQQRQRLGRACLSPCLAGDGAAATTGVGLGPSAGPSLAEG